MFWGAMAPTEKASRKERELLLFGIVASVFAVFVARMLALSLPFRERPIHNFLLEFKPPYSMDSNALIGWSSFPSDHAAVFFCLAMSLWFVSKRLGAVALGYSFLGVVFPRIYTGIHYPTDMLAGAALGIGIACLGQFERIRSEVVRPLWYWQEHDGASFTAFLFFVSFELAEEFDTLRHMGLLGYHGFEGLKQALR
jgi:undecaprenyl-diphosphatase